MCKYIYLHIFNTSTTYKFTFLMAINKANSKINSAIGARSINEMIFFCAVIVFILR